MTPEFKEAMSVIIIGSVLFTLWVIGVYLITKNTKKKISEPEVINGLICPRCKCFMAPIHEPFAGKLKGYQCTSHYCRHAVNRHYADMHSDDYHKYAKPIEHP